MTTQTQQKRIDDVILFEENHRYSRKAVTIGSGANLKIGAVLGEVTATKKLVHSDPTADDGSQTPVAVLITDADAASADVSGALVVYQHAIAIRSGLIFHAAIDDETKRNAACAALADAGVKVQ